MILRNLIAVFLWGVSSTRKDVFCIDTEVRGYEC